MCVCVYVCVYVCVCECMHASVHESVRASVTKYKKRNQSNKNECFLFFVVAHDMRSTTATLNFIQRWHIRENEFKHSVANMCRYILGDIFLQEELYFIQGKGKNGSPFCRLIWCV